METSVQGGDLILAAAAGCCGALQLVMRTALISGCARCWLTNWLQWGEPAGSW